MKSLTVYGGASKKEIKTFDIGFRDYETNLMDFLLKNGIPVASSCGGDGICQKCAVTIGYQKLLSCQLNIRLLFKESDAVTLEFSYL